MLVLTRKTNEKVYIGRNITVTVVAFDLTPGQKPKVRLGFEAPDDVRIMREELLEQDQSKEER